MTRPTTPGHVAPSAAFLPGDLVTHFGRTVRLTIRLSAGWYGRPVVAGVEMQPTAWVPGGDAVVLVQAQGCEVAS